MGCEICGRGSCARWMHSLSEQEEYDNPTDWESKYGELVYAIEDFIEDMEMSPDSRMFGKYWAKKAKDKLLGEK